MSASIYVISLERTPDRLARFSADNAGVASWDVFPAIDGQTVEPAVREGLGDTTLWTAGALGSGLSHIALWRRCIATGEPITVCEDDAILRGDFAAASDAVLGGLDGFDIVLWGWNFDCVMQAEVAAGVRCTLVADQAGLRREVPAFQAQRTAPAALRLVKALGLPAYTISPKGAAALLAACTPFQRRRLTLPLMPAPVDNVTADTAMAHAYADLQAFVAVPPLAATRNEWAISTVRNKAAPLPPAEAQARATALEAEGRALEALELLQVCATRAPHELELWVALGLALAGRSRLAAAAGAFERALEIAPAHPAVLYNLARVRLFQECAADALRLLDQAIDGSPDFALARCNRGVAHLTLGRAAEAASDFRAALELDPRLAEAHRGLAAACEALSDLAGQAQALRALLALAPSDDALVDALGEIELKLLVLAQQRGDLDAAARLAASAARAPHHRSRALIAGSNLAELQGRFDDAHAFALEATALEPGSPHAFNNLGVACLRLDRAQAAETAYRAAIARAPHYADAHHGLGFALLKQGRWEEGWPECSWRLRRPEVLPWVQSFDRPLWLGDRQPGATLLLAAEQGLGDTLQAITLIPDIADKVERIVLAVPPTLVGLLRRTPGVAFVVADDGPRPPHDIWCPLMSLPGLVGVTPERAPASKPVLTVDAAQVGRWRERLPPGRRIGIAWQGNPSARVEHGRSFPLAAMAPLARGGAALISLQKGFGAEQVQDAPFPVHELPEPYVSGDFEETAAVVAALDLVVCCDTAVGHLAGVLGRPAWIALGVNPDWRWLSQRNDAVWYSTTKLCRRRADESWADLFERLAAELRDLPSERRRR